MKRFAAACLFALSLVGLAGSPAAAAEGFAPTQTTFLIGNAAGGGNDLLVRALLPGMSKALGVDVTTEILLGANGGVAAVRTRQAGPVRFVDMHVLVPGGWTVQRGHDLCEEIEREVRSILPRASVLTHLEPIEDPRAYESWRR